MVVLNEIFSVQAKAKITALTYEVNQKFNATSTGDIRTFHITLSEQDDIFHIVEQTLQIGNLVAVIAPFGLLFFVFGAGKMAGLIGSATPKGRANA